MTSLRLAIALSVLPIPALADEVWESGFGTVIYLEDKGETAIFENTDFDDTTRLYFPGLAGNFDDRGVHGGYWIQEGGAFCDASLTGADGLTGGSWGRLTLVFHSPGFPSDWTLLRGNCFDEPNQPLRGAAKVAD